MEIPRFKPCIELPLNDEVFKEITEKTKDWAIMHGAAMRSKKNFNPDSLIFAPFTLIPSTFPRTEFQKAIQLQPVLNELVHRVAHSHEFLEKTLKNTILADNFTGRLYKIYETVREEGITQQVSLAIVRSDVMVEASFREPKRISLKQVEFNTIASGFGHLGPISAAIHRFVLKELGRSELLQNLPDNDAMAGLCEGMVAAWKYYNVPQAVILFVVEDITYNICDQRFHEYFIRDKYPEIKVIRRSLTQIFQKASLGQDKRLIIDGLEVALVYYRSGYEPCQYPSDNEWTARLLVERSLAIKCPTIQYHLAGTKKVQQALAMPGVVETLFADAQQAAAVRDIFTGIYSLDKDEEGDRAVKMALERPKSFVLKPQREGGGNNVYDENVARKIREMENSEERNGWILMDRIQPPVQQTYVLRAGDKDDSTITHDVVSELGVFGTIFGDADKIYVNEQCGHMLRTKLSTSDEGGVAAGSGCLDSPILVDSYC